MANQNTLGGLNPIQMNGESVFRASLVRFYIPASDTNAYYVGDPVVRTTNVSGQGVQGVTLATGAAVTGAVVGFVGATAANSAVTPTLRGLPVGPVFRPASTTQDWYVLVSSDPQTQYSIQVSNTDVLPASAIGKSATLVAATAGNPITGSAFTLNANSVASGSQQTVTITALDPYAVNNDPTQPYAKYLVKLNTSTETSAYVGI